MASCYRQSLTFDPIPVTSLFAEQHDQVGTELLLVEKHECRDGTLLLLWLLSLLAVLKLLEEGGTCRRVIIVLLHTSQERIHLIRTWALATLLLVLLLHLLRAGVTRSAEHHVADAMTDHRANHGASHGGAHHSHHARPSSCGSCSCGRWSSSVSCWRRGCRARWRWTKLWPLCEVTSATLTLVTLTCNLGHLDATLVILVNHLYLSETV